ncbi:hypothetical protein D3C85_1414340 [compost metagenome]
MAKRWNLQVASRVPTGHAAMSDQPKQEAVTLSAEAYQALLDELEDLRIERVACDRIATVHASELLSLETMRARFR